MRLNDVLSFSRSEMKSKYRAVPSLRKATVACILVHFKEL